MTMARATSCGSPARTADATPRQSLRSRAALTIFGAGLFSLSAYRLPRGTVGDEMSGMLNFLVFAGLAAAMFGEDLARHGEEWMFPVVRSEKFATFTIAIPPWTDGDPCHPNAIYNPLLTARQRIIDCY